MSKNVMLFRKELDTEGEMETASAYFDVREFRSGIPDNSFVVGRYSVLPFYKELEQELALKGSRLINSYKQHSWIADVGAWAYEGSPIEHLTPRTWLGPSDLPEGKSFVLKGATNSRKHQWNTHMFAQDKRAAVEVYCRLMEDTMIGQQQIYVREYRPLKRLMTGFNGLPITMEFRFFCAYKEILSSAYYWASHAEDLPEVPNPDIVPREILAELMDYVSRHANAYVLDIAQTEDGDWILIEINDLQMSGLGLNQACIVYKHLQHAIGRNRILR